MRLSISRTVGHRVLKLSQSPHRGVPQDPSLTRRVSVGVCHTGSNWEITFSMCSATWVLFPENWFPGKRASGVRFPKAAAVPSHRLQDKV